MTTISDDKVYYIASSDEPTGNYSLHVQRFKDTFRSFFSRLTLRCSVLVHAHYSYHNRQPVFSVKAKNTLHYLFNTKRQQQDSVSN